MEVSNFLVTLFVWAMGMLRVHIYSKSTFIIVFMLVIL